MIAILQADALHIPLAAGTVQTVVTSPPYYGLRDYGVSGQIGLEQTPAEYVAKLVEVFRECWRVMRDDATLWVNLGDTYGTGTTAGRTPGKRGIGVNTQNAQDSLNRVGGASKQLFGIPWRVAFALQADGWYLRSDIIWAKPNPMPESVTDRPTKSHEYIFLLSKQERYYYDAIAIQEQAIYAEHHNRYHSKASGREENNKNADNLSGNNGGLRGLMNENNGFRNRRSVWTVATQPYAEAHFATFPPKLIEPCILAGSRPGDIVLDPFAGSGTTLAVADKHHRHAVGLDLNPAYIKLAEKRLSEVQQVLI